MSDDIETVREALEAMASLDPDGTDGWLRDSLSALDRILARLHAAEEEIGTLFGDAALIERIRVLEAELDRLREALERIAEIDRRGVAQHDLVEMLAIARAALTQEQHASQTKD